MQETKAQENSNLTIPDSNGNKTVENINYNNNNNNSSNSGNVLSLLQTVCESSVSNLNRGIVGIATTNANALIENAVKQLIQLSTNGTGFKGAGSPRNGVKTCSCIVHLILLQVRSFFFSNRIRDN